MNTLEVNQSKVGEIVSLNYNTAGVFQKYGIDFCCGGGVSVEKACLKKGLDTETVANELISLLNTPTHSSDSYNTWSISFLIDYIVNTHHNFVRNKLQEMGFYAARVAEVHGITHPENVEIYKLFLDLSKEMTDHMASEENEVFPLLKQIESLIADKLTIPDNIEKEFSTLVDQMEREHDGAGGLMKQIRSLTNDYTPPVDACTKYRILYQNLEAFEQDLHKHVHLENNVLFPKVSNLLF